MQNLKELGVCPRETCLKLRTRGWPGRSGRQRPESGVCSIGWLIAVPVPYPAYHLPVYSLVRGIGAEYAVAGGKPMIRLKSDQGIRHRAAYSGIGTMLFRWVSQGKTEAWRYFPSIQDPQPILLEEVRDDDGNQILQFTLEDLQPAAGFLRGRWEGAILAPAIHIDVPFGADIWIFLLRSPWFPLKLSLNKQALALAYDDSAASTSVSLQPSGGLSATMSTNGTRFKKVSLVMRRRTGMFESDEPIAEIETGNIIQSWNPIMRNFELCLITSSSMAMTSLSEIAKGLGADFSKGFFGPGALQGEYVLCDGPLTEYSLTMRADLGFLRHMEDSTGATLSW